MYQILKDAYDINNQLFTSSTLTATRGHTKKLFKHHTNSYTRSKIFSNRVINEWNPLPQFIDSSSVNKFKMLLDRHYSNCLLDYIAMVFIMANYIAMVTDNYKSLVSHTDEIMKSMRGEVIIIIIYIIIRPPLVCCLFPIPIFSKTEAAWDDYWLLIMLMNHCKVCLYKA